MQKFLACHLFNGVKSTLKSPLKTYLDFSKQFYLKFYNYKLILKYIYLILYFTFQLFISLPHLLPLPQLPPQLEVSLGYMWPCIMEKIQTKDTGKVHVIVYISHMWKNKFTYSKESQIFESRSMTDFSQYLLPKYRKLLKSGYTKFIFFSSC